MTKCKICITCTLIQVILSGAFGYLAGNYAMSLGIARDTSSALAGFVGFMGAQSFNYFCLLLTTRYRVLRHKKAIKHATV